LTRRGFRITDDDGTITPTTHPADIMTTSRRVFLRTGLALAAGAPLAVGTAHASARRVAPSDRITIGIIGYGRQARGLTTGLMNQPDTQVVAVSDVVRDRMEQGAQAINEFYGRQEGGGGFSGAAMYGDFRELIARDDIDAVLIATPDHWHAIPAIAAARAGKHIYCEKPLCHTIREGRVISDAARASGIAFQTGSQQRTGNQARFRIAADLVRIGRIGKLHTIRIGVGLPPVLCNLPGEPLPDGIDWDMWLGPAPYRPFNRELCPIGIHDHFPDWRSYSEYSGGYLADWGAHHFDIAQWALDMDGSGPVEVLPPVSGLNGGLAFRYANGVTMIHGNHRNAIDFIGTDGTVSVAREFIQASSPDILREPVPASPERLPDPGTSDHRRNWLDAIRGEARTVADAEVGHRTNTVCQLAIIGYTLRRPLRWDPVTETFPEDTEANRHLDKVYRHPWTLELA
jgi:predicted dehydrogenase